MVAGTIHDMNKQLTDLSQFFQDSTTRFVTVIKAHEARFTPGDYE